MIHPTFGVLEVIVESFSVNESLVDAQGMASFNITFKESGKKTFPKGKLQGLSKINEIGAAAITGINDEFVQKFSTKGHPQFVKDSAIDLLSEGADLYNTTSSSIKKNIQKVADIGQKARNFKAALVDIIEDPLKIAAQITALSDDLGAISFDTRELFSKYRESKDFAADIKPIQVTTDSRQAQQDNQESISFIIKNQGLVNSVLKASEMAETGDFESSTEAKEIQDELLTEIDFLSSVIDNDDLYLKLQELRSQLIRIISNSSHSLPSVKNVTPLITTNSIVLAYNEYENLDHELDIVKETP